MFIMERFKLKLKNIKIIMFLLSLITKNIFSEKLVYDVYKYNEFIKVNPALTLKSRDILLKADNSFSLENEKYETNNMRYENSQSIFLSDFLSILPVNNKFAFSFNLKYNYSSSNLFNRGKIFDTYETNRFVSKSYTAIFNTAKKVSKDLSIGYQLQYKKGATENKYIENNEIYDYKYLREINWLENNLGIRFINLFFKIGYIHKKLLDFYSDYENLTVFEKRNEFIFDIFNAGVCKPIFSHNKLKFLFNTEFSYIFDTKQNKFTIYNENFVIDVLEYYEKIDLYFFAKKRNILIFYGIQQEYVNFKRYNISKNKWEKNYNINAKITSGIDIPFLDFLEIYLENKLKFEKSSFADKIGINFFIIGGLTINAKKNISFEIRSSPEVLYFNSSNNKNYGYGLNIIFKFTY